jgi:hypothetical protein
MAKKKQTAEERAARERAMENIARFSPLRQRLEAELAAREAARADETPSADR